MLSQHASYNPGPAMPLGSDPASVARAKFDAVPIFEREPRASTMIRCPLPNIGLAQHTLTRDLLHSVLNATFGGFTSYPLLGGWRAPDGKDTIEDGTIYEVSFDADSRESENIATARNIFLQAGAHLGELWTRIEIHHFTTWCAQTSPAREPGFDPSLTAALARRDAANSPW